jgi:hypothetical protein
MLSSTDKKDTLAVPNDTASPSGIKKMSSVVSPVKPSEEADLPTQIALLTSLVKPFNH